MERGSVAEILQCPHCRADSPTTEDPCRACGRHLAIVIGPREPSRKLGIGSMMALIAGVAICLAVFRASPGLGVFLLLISLPAVSRTASFASQRAAVGRPMSLGAKVAVFLGSLGLTFATIVSSILAVALTGYAGVSLWQLASGNGEFGLAIGVAIGAMTAIFWAGFLLRSFWRREDC